jgi:ligand-binding sensor domain-containing protein
VKGLLFFLIITLPANNVFSQEPGVHFTHYTTKEGLPINSVKDITQDSLGFMWFATEEGLTRFDGYTFKVYKHDAENPESIRRTDVSQVLASRNGNIWVGGFDGLDSYDPKTEVFHHLDLDIPISYLQEDSKGNLWISTFGHGIRVYHPKDSSFTAFQHDPADANSIHGNFVKSSIYEDRNGAIWIAAGGTVQSLDLSSGTFTNYPFQGIIRSILEDRQENMWLCDEAGALIHLDKRDSSVVYHLRNENTYRSVGGLFSTLFKDSKGSLWVGTGSQGLILFDPESGQTERYEHDINDEYSISSNSINDIYEDRAGN